MSRTCLVYIRNKRPFPQVLRDGHDKAPGDRGLQAPRGDAQRGAAHLRVQARVPLHLRLGDPRQAPLGRNLLQRQRAQREWRKSRRKTFNPAGIGGGRGRGGGK